MHISIPNSLTTLRIAIIPFIYYFAFQHNKTALIILFSIGGLTDALDGFLARMLKTESPKGRMFDTIADVLFYPSALLIYLFIPEAITENLIIIIIMLLVLAISLILCARWRKLTTQHAWTAKTASASVYLFVITTLIFGYSRLFVYLVATLCVIAALDKVRRCRT